MAMTDREAFAERIRAYRQAGERDLLTAGIAIDNALVRELREPGSDRRFGVNLICRPACEVVDRIAAIQRRLFEFEPEQYYYPPRDLHLTLVEICHSRTPEEADRIAAAVQRVAGSLFDNGPLVELDEPSLVFDRSAAALSFLPCDGQLQQLRKNTSEYLAGSGITVQSRYAPASAHVTLLRYAAPLKTGAPEWVEVLNHCDTTLATRWTLSSFWLTWCGNWYGMHDRISRIGPLGRREQAT